MHALSKLSKAFRPLGISQLRCLSQTTRALGDASKNMPQIIDCNQGEKVVTVFSQGEMDSRLQKLRTMMSEDNVEACVFTSYQNIAYYSGFVYCQFGRPYGMVITEDDATVIAANIDYGQPWRRSYYNAITYTDWKKDNFFRGVSQLVGNRGKVGLEYDHVSLENYQKFQDFLPKKELVDVSKQTMFQRMVKTPEEIAVIKNGARTADVGGFAAAAAIKENVPEREVALISTQAMIREIARTYPEAELLDTWTWFQSGINTDGAHNPVTSRPVQKGDILSLNCFPMIAGYYTALERTLFLDHASPRALELWEVNCKVHKRGQELIRPGTKCMDIALELNEIFAEHDMLQYRTFGYGHSFGVLCHYYGREAGLELREDIETVIKPNMVISMEPMLTVPEGKPGAGGYREHDILVVTEDGAENITKFPYGPEHNIIKA